MVAPKDHACPLTEAAIQTASGAAESVPYVMVTNLAGTISDLRERGVWVMGTADEADGTLYDHSIPSAVAWVLGNPNVASAIVGASRPEQLADSVRASGVVLDDALRASIDEVLGDIVVRDPARTASPASRP